MPAFEQCLSDGDAKRRVAQSLREAQQLGLSRTPSIFVNGRPLASNHLKRDLEAMILEARSRKEG